MTWPDLRTSHGRLVWNFLSWDWVLAGIILFWIMLFILPGLYRLPLQLHNKVFKFNSMWRGDKRILFQIFSMQKITDLLSSNHHLSLYTSLWQYLIKKTGKAWNKQYESPLKTPFYHSIHLIEERCSEWVLSNDTNGGVAGHVRYRDQWIMSM